MSLLAPKGLWLLALLAPLVLLYILKIERQRRIVASTWLWAQAQRDLLARAPFRKLVPTVPLLLQAIALAALAVALARPASRGRELTGDHVAILVDTSASMTAKGSPRALDPDAPTRLDVAKRAAKGVVAALRPGSDALVVDAGRDARVLSPLDRDRRRLEAAIDGIAAHDAEGDLGAAIGLAVDRLRQLGGARRIVVVTDGSLARPTALANVALPIDVITVGEAIDNAALIRVDVRSGVDPVDHREQVQGFVVVANYGAIPRDVYVTMREANASDVLASRHLLVPPGERMPVVLTFRPTAGDYRKGLVFEIAPHDAMPVDDIAYARVPAGEKLPAYLVARDPKQASPWLERALAADPMLDLKKAALDGFVATPTAEPDALVVIEGACPANAPGGDLLLVDPPAGPCLGTIVGQPIDAPAITSWDIADPRMRFLSLDGVHVAKARALSVEGMARALIQSPRGPIATDVSTATRTATLLGFDVADSDWPLKASFVLFVRNIVELARAHRAHGITGPVRVGDPLRVTVPGTATSVEATGPAGEHLEASLRTGLAVVPSTDRAGLYHVAWQGPQPGSVVIPANLTSEAESDVRSKPLDTSAGDVHIAEGGARPDAHTEWAWALGLVALAFLLFDVWYWTRRPRRARTSPAPAPRIPARRAA